ncbi:MAG TPA: undecaprenyl-diphosphate phosphatase [Thermodesulfovibrionales bacterium]|nr:undecaprenyl-diphosphate phosphatase [Thermodesulfovibrionales bacterium]
MLQALILGIVQGLTEFLPVSSTAHLILFPWFFNWSGEVNTLSFDVALHGGTLLALLLCFWRDWLDLLLRKHALLGLIVLSSIPAGIVGLLLNKFAEHSLRSPILISVMLVAGGLVMLAAEKIYKYRSMEKITLKDAVFIGAAQAVAILPGVSRSGFTIAAGLFRGLERESAARFSFLLSTPVIGGAFLLHLKGLVVNHADHDSRLFAIGLATSFITGLIAIKFMMSFLKRYPLNVFVYYRFVLAVVIIAGIWLRG